MRIFQQCLCSCSLCLVAVKSARACPFSNTESSLCNEFCLSRAYVAYIGQWCCYPWDTWVSDPWRATWFVSFTPQKIPPLVIMTHLIYNHCILFQQTPFFTTLNLQWKFFFPQLWEKKTIHENSNVNFKWKCNFSVLQKFAFLSEITTVDCSEVFPRNAFHTQIARH